MKLGLMDVKLAEKHRGMESLHDDTTCSLPFQDDIPEPGVQYSPVPCDRQRVIVQERDMHFPFYGESPFSE